MMIRNVKTHGRASKGSIWLHGRASKGSIWLHGRASKDSIWQHGRASSPLAFMKNLAALASPIEEKKQNTEN